MAPRWRRGTLAQKTASGRPPGPLVGGFSGLYTAGLRHGRSGCAGWKHVNKSDSLFLKKFSMVLGFLLLLTLVLILFAHHLNKLLPHEQTEQAKAQVEARIAPVGAVYAGRDGVAQQMAAAEAMKAAASSNAAYGGTMDGKVIYDSLCTGCHTSGAGGAPKLDAAGIGARMAAQGADELVKKAIEGFTGSSGVMPAKGGNPALTDDQVKATVEWMIGQSK